VTAPISPNVHPDPHRIATDRAPADAERSERAGAGVTDTDDAAQGSLSGAVSVDVRSAISAENRASAASVPEHVQAAADLISTLGAQIAANPAGARAAHGDLNGQDVLSLLG
jgi:hypothetical protein